jgi:hypothetical protein
MLVQNNHHHKVIAFDRAPVAAMRSKASAFAETVKKIASVIWAALCWPFVQAAKLFQRKVEVVPSTEPTVRPEEKKVEEEKDPSALALGTVRKTEKKDRALIKQAQLELALLMGAFGLEGRQFAMVNLEALGIVGGVAVLFQAPLSKPMGPASLQIEEIEDEATQPAAGATLRLMDASDVEGAEVEGPSMRERAVALIEDEATQPAAGAILRLMDASDVEAGDESEKAASMVDTIRSAFRSLGSYALPSDEEEAEVEGPSMRERAVALIEDTRQTISGAVDTVASTAEAAKTQVVRTARFIQETAISAREFFTLAMLMQTIAVVLDLPAQGPTLDIAAIQKDQKRVQRAKVRAGQIKERRLRRNLGRNAHIQPKGAVHMIHAHKTSSR